MRVAGEEGPGHKECSTGEMLDRRDTGLLGCRTGGMQDWRVAGLEGAGLEECRKGGIQDRKDKGQ